MATFYLGNLREVVEQRPPTPATYDENGITASRRFSVLSTSRIAAILRLRALGIDRGRPYQEPGGGVPDPFCLCQRIMVTGKPDAIAAGWFVNGQSAGGGLGQYICDVEYSRKQTSPGAQPGGPVRWSRRASLVSTPVDMDADGFGIFSSSWEAPDQSITALLPEEVLHGEFYWQAADELAAIKAFRPFEGKLNDKLYPKLGADRGGLLIHPFTTQPADTGWIFMTVDIQYKPPKLFLDGTTFEGWIDVFPDYGTRQVVSDTNTDINNWFAPILDSTGAPVTSPVPLDGQGHPAPMVPVTSGALPKVYHRAVRNYKYADFGQIPFPG